MDRSVSYVRIHKIGISPKRIGYAVFMKDDGDILEKAIMTSEEIINILSYDWISQKRGAPQPEPNTNHDSYNGESSS